MGRRHQRILTTEQFESRRPLAADLAALDVNDDMSVTPLDALIVINRLNQLSSGQRTSAEAEATSELNCDTNSDGVVTPIDALGIINQINSGVVTVPATSSNTVTAAVVVLPGDATSDTPSDSTDTSSPVDSTPVDDTTTTTPDDSATDDSDTTDDGSDSSTPTDSTDDTTDDSNDDVVSDPTDDSDDSSDDDTSNDDADNDTSDDDTSNDDTGNDDSDEPCHRPQPINGTGRGGFALDGSRGGPHGRGHGGLRGPGDIFADLDANGDGALSSDEVPDFVWDDISAADADGSDSITSDELTAYRQAQRVAAVEKIFEQLDANGDGSLTSADVSRMEWRFLTRADADSDGAITVDELLAVPAPGRWGGH